MPQEFIPFKSTKQKEIPDSELVMNLLENGNESSFAILYERHKNQVFGILFKFLKNKEEAEDGTQEFFIRIKKQLEQNKYNEQGTFANWLMRCATNFAIDRFKLKKSTLDRPLEYDYDKAFSKLADSENPEKEIHAKELKELITAILESSGIDQDSQKAFTLRIFDEYSYQEIADIQKVPLGTVQSRISRVKAYVREALTEAKEEPFD